MLITHLNGTWKSVPNKQSNTNNALLIVFMNTTQDASETEEYVVQ